MIMCFFHNSPFLSTSPELKSSFLVLQELPGGYGRVKPDVVTYGSGVRGSSLKYVLFC